MSCDRIPQGFVPLLCALLFLGTPSGSANAAPTASDLNAAAASLIQSLNSRLAAAGWDLQIASIDLFTIGVGRPEDRIHQNTSRWVPGDPRRHADGNNLTYLVRQQFTQVGGLIPSDVEAAIDRAYETWQDDSCVSNTTIVKRADPGIDTDVFDELIGQGDTSFPNFAYLFEADIVIAGFRPRTFFDAMAPQGGDYILGTTVTFHFLTDANNDHFFDTAFVETYYNANPDFSWGIDIGLPGTDVETVALHESGHSLGVGHFGPPPQAVMNPIYGGIRQSLLPVDRASMCTVWGSWPDR
jgi:hypothetical protein